ncbi:MAG: DUF1232 domain-containing protein [Myxococcaceae bacterium]
MNVANVRRYVKSPKVAGWKKVLGVLAVLYAISPIDLVPDTIPVIGWLDDLGLLSVAFGLIVRDMGKHAERERASEAVIEGTARVVE